VFGLFVAGTIILGLWAVSAIVGVVEAPPIVVAGGIVALVVIAVGASASFRAFRRISEPLDALVAAAGRVEAGDYSVRVPVADAGEMGSLTRAFNQMASRLEAGDARRRAFLAEVAHELRTPLTVLQGQLEAMADGIYPADRDRLVALQAQTRAMARLVDDLRTISLAEVGALDLHPVVADLVPLLDEIVMAHEPAARRQGVRLTAGPVSAPALARIDLTATRRVLANIVANSLRHTPAGGRVELVVHDDASSDRATIVVRDTGTGVPADLLPNVFERFVKGGASDGTGLGLAIARDLVEAMGGRIEMASQEGVGTTVTIRLPKA
jgi:signal transduction histidine kinase